MDQSVEGKSARGVLQDDGSGDIPSLMSVGMRLRLRTTL